MLPQQRRTRVMWCRVSADEYQRFSQFCVSSGARSLSEAVRSAVQQVMSPGVAGAEGSFADHVHQLEIKLQQMDEKLEQLLRGLPRASIMEMTEPSALEKAKCGGQGSEM